MRTMKIRPGRGPTNARTWGARIPAARDGQDASAEHGTSTEHGTSAEQDTGHAVAALYRLHYPALVRLAALLIPDLATAEDIVQDAFAGSAVMSALRALTARQREVVVLRYFADLPEAEIASATGMSMAAVRNHAAQAMSSLQAGLG